ncbi:MAG: cytochrome b N-terminal domain-containing protein [Chloroflexi bacterium]|nr:cytochrome b N-terminal domain-containing protein [Chloroflexota bacterium]
MLPPIPAPLRAPLDRAIEVNKMVLDLVRQSPPWKSIFRNAYPNTDENRALVMFNSFFLHIMPVKVKQNTLKWTYTFGLGLMTFYLFLLLFITGIILMFLYVPAAERAYQDMQRLGTSVAYGQLLRNSHRWAAHLMVLFVFLHMCRVFYTGGYKPPRDFNWVVGVLLLVLTLLLSFSGYILTWDQLAASAITVGANIGGASPFLGGIVKAFILGADEPGPATLIRVYAFHVILLPTAVFIMAGVHFWRIRKDGGLSAPATARKARHVLVPSARGGFTVKEVPPVSPEAQVPPSPEEVRR